MRGSISLIQARYAAAKKLPRALPSLRPISATTANSSRTLANGERRRQAETISTAFVESTINQVVSRRFVKKQQIGWTLRGAHLLLQTQTKVLNDELEDVFRR